MGRVRRALVRCNPLLPLENLDIVDGIRLQIISGRSMLAAQIAQIAASEQHGNGLWGKFNL